MENLPAPVAEFHFFAVESVHGGKSGSTRVEGEEKGGVSPVLEDGLTEKVGPATLGDGRASECNCDAYIIRAIASAQWATRRPIVPASACARITDASR